MRPRDTNDITRVIYGPSENEAGCVGGDHIISNYLAVSTLRNRVPQLWRLSGGRKVTPGGDMRTDDTLLTPRREQIAYIVPEVGLAKHT